MGRFAAATRAASLLVATVLFLSTALLTPPTSLSYALTGSHTGKIEQVSRQINIGWKEQAGGDGRRREVARQRSLAEEDGGGGDAGVRPILFPLASAKRQVPTGADPIHHNGRPPSLHHRHFP